MKEETNNEMDLLLRRLGRRPDISVSDANGDVDHLDADELSAYAENVLPAAARARYTTHLAECARCRELVVHLSSSAGVVPAAETTGVSAPSALRKFLASLFSPMVLRYAVPALGLIVIAAIGLFVLKPKQGHDASIAQKTEAPASTNIANTNSPEPASPSAYNYVQPTQQEAPKPPHSSGSPGDQSGTVASEPPAPAGQLADAPRDEFAKKEVQQPIVTEAPKPTPAPEREESKRPAEAEAPKVQVTGSATTGKTVDAVVKDEDRKTAEIAKARSDADANKAGSFGMAPSTAARTRGQSDDVREKGKNDTETRTVAGRHFRKQGSVWIDTAYDSSRSITNFTRGTEPYRVLIADEPGIKTIADQLDGEVIVVWKGRTYRIR